MDVLLLVRATTSIVLAPAAVNEFGTALVVALVVDTPFDTDEFPLQLVNLLEGLLYVLDEFVILLVGLVVEGGDFLGKGNPVESR